MSMQKRGLSSVITSVLLVAIVIVLVVGVWFSIKPSITEAGKGIEREQSSLFESIKEAMGINKFDDGFLI